jgi:hypothetical protein
VSTFLAVDSSRSLMAHSVSNPVCYPNQKTGTKLFSAQVEKSGKRWEKVGKSGKLAHFGKCDKVGVPSRQVEIG